MHVAAANPASLSEDDLDQAMVEREKQVLTDQARESGKPDNIIENMIKGRMKKYLRGSDASEPEVRDQPGSDRC